jgi:hypothetical protein
MSTFRRPELNDCYECRPGISWLGEPAFQLMDRVNGGWRDQDGVFISDAELAAAIQCGDVSIAPAEPQPSTEYARGRADALRDAVALLRKCSEGQPRDGWMAGVEWSIEKLEAIR